jgi:hypothetical protein
MAFYKVLYLLQRWGKGQQSLKHTCLQLIASIGNQIILDGSEGGEVRGEEDGETDHYVNKGHCQGLMTTEWFQHENQRYYGCWYEKVDAINQQYLNLTSHK